MKTVKLDNGLREQLLHAYLEGHIALTGYEQNLTAVAINEPTKDCVPAQTVLRLLRAKQITLLSGVNL